MVPFLSKEKERVTFCVGTVRSDLTIREDVARRRLCLGERDLRVNTFKVSIVVSRITLWRVRNRAARIASCASARRTCASKERPKVERTATELWRRNECRIRNIPRAAGGVAGTRVRYVTNFLR